MEARYALLALQERRLKVSRFLELNDRYDCAPIITAKGKLAESDPEEFERCVLTRMHAEFGLLSYSGTAENLLMVRLDELKAND